MGGATGYAPAASATLDKLSGPVPLTVNKAGSSSLVTVTAKQDDGRGGGPPARIMREDSAALSVPSPPEGERVGWKPERKFLNQSS